MQAIKDYENNKWKVIGQKVGKPAKVRNPVFLSNSPVVTWPGLCSGHNRITVAVMVALPFAIYSDFLASISIMACSGPHVGPSFARSSSP